MDVFRVWCFVFSKRKESSFFPNTKHKTLNTSYV
jgi:hypothetical protein